MPRQDSGTGTSLRLRRHNAAIEAGDAGTEDAESPIRIRWHGATANDPLDPVKEQLKEKLARSPTVRLIHNGDEDANDAQDARTMARVADSYRSEELRERTENGDLPASIRKISHGRE